MTLAELLDRLRASPRVRGVLLTGSAVTALGPASDLDLAIILDVNSEGLRTLFTTVEDRFADLYVFDAPFVEAIRTAPTLSPNSWEGIFAARLRAGRIEHDPDGVLAALNHRLESSPPAIRVAEADQYRLWLKLNYDLATNLRYLASAIPLYHRALEIRLLYSVTDAVTGYFTLRGIGWNGEKAAVKYFDESDPATGGIMQECLRAGSVDLRMASYLRLMDRVWHGPFQRWPAEFLIPGDVSGGYAPALAGFWRKLLGES